MPRLKTMVEGPSGWTDWEYPLLKGYRVGCCHCGLVHDLEFAVISVERYTKAGKNFIIGDTVVTGNRGKWRVAMRARQNARSTSQLRRHRHTKKKPRRKAGS